MKKLRLFLPLLLLAALPGRLPASTVTLTFTTLPSNMENGTYNGFVGGTINGIAFDDLICDDYNHTTYVPSQGVTFDVFAISDYSQARFGAQTNALENYQDAALLVYSIENLPAVNAHLAPNQQLTIGDLQYSLWDLFTPSSGNTANSANALPYLHAAEPSLSLPGDLEASLRIFVPTGVYTSNQEFLQILESGQTQAANPSVPEPQTLALAAAGLLTMAAIAWKRRRLPAINSSAASG